MILKRRAQAVVIDKGHILLVQHYNPVKEEYYWCLPGGSIDAGEDAVQAVIREVQEETGLTIAVIAESKGDEYPAVTAGYHRTYLLMAVVLAGELQLGYDPEQPSASTHFLKDVAWKPLDEQWLPKVREFLYRQQWNRSIGYKEFISRTAICQPE